MKLIRGAVSLKVILGITGVSVVVLSGVAIPFFMTKQHASEAAIVDKDTQGKETELRADLANLRNAEYQFWTDTNYFPLTLSDLTAKSSSDLSVPNTVLSGKGVNVVISKKVFHGPYIQSIPTDPISGQSFVYSTDVGTIGAIKSSASGQASDGTNYSDF